MIEKIKNKTGTYCGQTLPVRQDIIINKINELVDAVNELQEAFESIHPCFNYKDKLKWVGRRCNFSNDCENWIEDIFVNIDRTDSEPEIPKYRASNGKLYKYCKLTTEPEPVDPYAEQRKWIGKICKFWDNDDTQEFLYGVLTAIDTDFGVGYSCNGEYEYDNCEPVKPDDDIIYKGE